MFLAIIHIRTGPPRAMHDDRIVMNIFLLCVPH